MGHEGRAKVIVATKGLYDSWGEDMVRCLNELQGCISREESTIIIVGISSTSEAVLTG